MKFCPRNKVIFLVLVSLVGQASNAFDDSFGSGGLDAQSRPSLVQLEQSTGDNARYNPLSIRAAVGSYIDRTNQNNLEKFKASMIDHKNKYAIEQQKILAQPFDEGVKNSLLQALNTRFQSNAPQKPESVMSVFNMFAPVGNASNMVATKLFTKEKLKKMALEKAEQQKESVVTPGVILEETRDKKSDFKNSIKPDFVNDAPNFTPYTSQGLGSMAIEAAKNITLNISDWVKQQWDNLGDSSFIEQQNEMRQAQLQEQKFLAEEQERQKKIYINQQMLAGVSPAQITQNVGVKFPEPKSWTDRAYQLPTTVRNWAQEQADHLSLTNFIAQQRALQTEQEAVAQ